MAKEPKYSGHDHKSASELARCLCDHLYECLPAEFSPRKHSANNTCAAYVAGRNASLYWLYHYRYHVKVYLYGKYILDISCEIQKLMPPDVLLETRPLLRTNAEISMPCFFVLRSEEQSRSLGPVLRYLSEHRAKSFARSKTATDTYWHSPSESEGAEANAAEEGNRTAVLVNKYERQSENRDACIRANGTSCKVCGFDFPSMFGSIGFGANGKGYIHVHHLTTLASLKGKARRFDPAKDMLPVCPNCHEMLHQIDPPYTPEQLQAIIAEAKEKASSLRSSNP
jgi:hypothetical protein